MTPASDVFTPVGFRAKFIVESLVASGASLVWTCPNCEFSLLYRLVWFAKLQVLGVCICKHGLKLFATYERRKFKTFGATSVDEGVTLRLSRVALYK